MHIIPIINYEFLIPINHIVLQQHWAAAYSFTDENVDGMVCRSYNFTIHLKLIIERLGKGRQIGKSIWYKDYERLSDRKIQLKILIRACRLKIKNF